MNSVGRVGLGVLGVIAASATLLMAAGMTLPRALFVGINLVTLACFGYDKCQAAAGGWRVPEAALYLLAAVGGTPGAVMGMILFRHKTRSTGFRAVMACIALAQVMAGLGLAWLGGG
jgi:uncharacterized membrane protein YsdA (DUF1294 family)